MNGLLQDARYGWRMLRRQPGLTVVAVLLLAVAIGANAAIFSFINALYIKPLPVRRADGLVRVYAKGPAGGFDAGFSYPEYDLLREYTSLKSLAAESLVAQLHLVAEGDSEELRGAFVTANYFSLLETQPLIGRWFLPEEDAVPDRNPVVVLGYTVWKNQFGADSAVIGRIIAVNGIKFTIIGVAPPGFHGDQPDKPIELWFPSMMLHAAGYAQCPGWYDCSVIDELIGRMPAGRSLAEVQAETRGRVVWSATDWPARKGSRSIVVLSARGVDPDTRADFSLQMRLLTAVTGMLLLIACANLAGLFLVRGVTRRREIAVRLSLGASRPRIVRQLLSESLLTSCLGGVLGLLLSILAKSWLQRFYSLDSEGFYHSYNLSLDWRVLLYSALLTVATGMLFGLAPALSGTRYDLLAELKESAGWTGLRRGSWLRYGLVAAQIALAMALLVLAGLLARSGFAVQRGTNLDPQKVVLLRARPKLASYTPGKDGQFLRAVVRRLEATPGVESVALVTGGNGFIWQFESARGVQVNLRGQEQGNKQPLPDVSKHDVGPLFFQTLRIPILHGRAFGEMDQAGTPRVVILNTTLAKQLWPDGSAVGRTVVIDGQNTQVVGIAASIQPHNSTQPARPFVYLPFWQSDPRRWGDIRVAVRVSGDPVVALPALRRAIQSVDPNVPIGEDMPLTQQMSLEYAPLLLGRSVMFYSAIVALCLCAVGLYSVLAFTVRTRTREIGIRMALGAQGIDVIELILRQGARVALLGGAIGLAFALASTRLIAGWLYGVDPFDSASFVAGAVVLLLMVLAASYIPARSAARIEPMVALRAD